jgi:hypothetical protein
MGFLRWLFGKPNKEPDHIEFRIKPPVGLQQDGVPSNQHKEVSNARDDFSFFVDGLQTEFKEFSQVGESVKLWIPMKWACLKIPPLCLPEALA